MELSNRTIGVVGMTVMLSAMAYRAYSNRVQIDSATSQLAVSSFQVPASTGPVTQRTFNPNSVLLPPIATSGEVPTPYQGYGPAQRQPITNAPVAATDDEATADETPQDDGLAYDDTQSVMPTYADVGVNVPGRYPVDLPGDMSNQQIFDRMLSLARPRDRAALVGTWLSMTPEEQLSLLGAIRGGGQ